MKRVTPNGAHHLEQSLSVVMPTLADHVLLDQDEEDRVALPNGWSALVFASSSFARF